MADIGSIKANLSLNTKEFSTNIEKAKRQTKGISREADGAKKSFEGVESAMTAIGSSVAFYGVISAIRTVTKEAGAMQMSLQGLTEVSKALGKSVDDSTALAQKFANEGLMTVSDAASAVKDSLTMGLSLEETEKMMRALADASAYNRDSHLDMSQAILQGVQASKRMESELLENTGITENISVMTERYAESIGTTAGKLTEAQKMQGIYNGILENAELYQGNAKKSLDDYAGSVSRFQNSVREAKAELGEGFLPVVQSSLESITPVIVNTAKWAAENKELVVGIGTASVTITGLVSVLSTLVVGINVLRVSLAGLSIALGPTGWLIAGLSILTPAILTATSAMGKLSDASDDNFNKTQNLTREYDALERKLGELEEGTAEAVQVKERMAQITETLRDLSPELVSAIDNETESVNKLTNALARNKREQISNLKAKLTAKKSELKSIQERAAQDTGRSIMGSTFNPNAELEKTRMKELQGQISDAENAYNALIYNQYADQRVSADKALERVQTDTSIEGANYDDVDTSTSASGASSSGSSNNRPKTASEIAHEQYQKERRQLRHKRTMDKLTLEEERAKLEKLRAAYSKYADIRMELDEEIYRVENEMGSQSFKQSVEAIEEEERKMLENGKTSVEVAEMKEDAYSRLAEKYGENAEYMKQVEQNLHTVRMTLLREEKRERSEVIDELNRQRSDFIDGQKEKLSDLKDAELESINERKQAELDALDEKRQGINDYYDEQLDQIDEDEYAEERKKLQEQIEKYRYSTSRDGQQKLAELKEKMRRMDRDEERRQLREEKEDKLDALDEEERNIEAHYNEMRDVIRNYNGDREQLFADTNANILDGIRTFVDQYNAELSRMKRTQASTPSDDASNSPGKDGIYYKGEHYDSEDFDKKDFNTDDMLITRDGKTYTYDEYANAVTYGEIPEGKFHTGGVVGQSNFASGSGLLPNEVASILERGEVVMTPKQIESLIGGKGQSAGPTNYYYGPLIGHDGDVKLEDDADVSTYWRERELAAARLMSEGER